MIISKNPDGTSTYSGAAIPIVETLAQILDLKYITFIHLIQALLRYCVLV